MTFSFASIMPPVRSDPAHVRFMLAAVGEPVGRKAGSGGWLLHGPSPLPPVRLLGQNALLAEADNPTGRDVEQTYGLDRFRGSVTGKCHAVIDAESS
jgi:hypothetical protein